MIKRLTLLVWRWCSIIYTSRCSCGPWPGLTIMIDFTTSGIFYVASSQILLIYIIFIIQTLRNWRMYFIMKFILSLYWVMLLFRLTLLVLLLLLRLLLIYRLYERILNSLTHCGVIKPTFIIISLQLVINYRWFLRIKRIRS